MRLHQPLDQILDSSAKVRILRFLCLKGGEWSGRRIAAKLDLNPVTAHAALKELHEATILDFDRVGNSFIYSLREEHYLVREVLKPLFEQEANAKERLLELFRRRLESGLKSEILSAAVYGSVERHQERPTSDVDLLVLVPSEQAKQKVEHALDRLWEKVSREFGNPLSIYVNTVREARQKVERRLPVLENILRHHKVIWGVPLEGILHA